jgi:hypothetical protein
MPRVPENDENPANAGLSKCAEEDSNLHPVIPDQALNLVTPVSYPSYASRTSESSGFLDAMDVMDDLDVAADVATGGLAAQTAWRRRSVQVQPCDRTRVSISRVVTGSRQCDQAR